MVGALFVSSFDGLRVHAVRAAAIYLSALSLTVPCARAADDETYASILDRARAGDAAHALDALAAWQSTHPDDLRARFDAVVVLGWAGRTRDALDRARELPLDTLPGYVLRSAARSAIDIGAPDWADAALTRAEACCADDADGLREIEALRTAWAVRVVVASTEATPHRYHALAWWADRLNEPADPRVDAARAREAVLLASSLGAHERALAWLPRATAAMSDDERAHVLADAGAQRLRWAGALPPAAHPQIEQHLTVARQDLDQARALARAPALVDAIASDLVRAAAMQGDATAAHAAAADQTVQPAAALALADIDLRAGHAREAERRVRQVLAALGPGADELRHEALFTLHAALVEQARDDEARAIAAQLAADIPAWAFRGMRGVEAENPAYARVRALQSQPSITAVRRDGAWASSTALEAREHDAPFSVDVRLDRAEWSYARGASQAAARDVDAVLQDAPDDLRALELRARLLIDDHDDTRLDPILGRLRSAGAPATMLMGLDDVRRRDAQGSLGIDASVGTSDGNRPVFGTRDAESSVVALSPRVASHWRLAARWARAEARFDGARHVDDRVDVGLRGEWAGLRVDGRLAPAAGPQRTPGLRFSGDWSAIDTVTMSARAESRSDDVPLRARVAHVSGDLAHVGVAWRLAPGGTVGASATRLRLTDDNTRDALSAFAAMRVVWMQRLIGEGRIDADLTRNTRSDVSYYSPMREVAASITTAVEHTLWRDGDRGWSQRLALTAGRIVERGFASHLATTVSYEHAWRFDARHRIAISFSQTQRPYDGVVDRHRTIGLHFESPL